MKEYTHVWWVESKAIVTRKRMSIPWKGKISVITREEKTETVEKVHSDIL